MRNRHTLTRDIYLYVERICAFRAGIIGVDVFYSNTVANNGRRAMLECENHGITWTPIRYMDDNGNTYVGVQIDDERYMHLFHIQEVGFSESIYEILTQINSGSELNTNINHVSMNNDIWILTVQDANISCIIDNPINVTSLQRDFESIYGNDRVRVQKTHLNTIPSNIITNSDHTEIDTYPFRDYWTHQTNRRSGTNREI